MNTTSMLFAMCLFTCNNPQNNYTEAQEKLSPLDVSTSHSLINSNGNEVESRIKTPTSYVRIQDSPTSFGAFLRKQTLQPDGSLVHYYNGTIKENDDVYCAVLKVDVGTKDLQQCADAVMRLRAEYFWQGKMFDSIVFYFNNGFKVPYSKWRAGNRILFKGNNCLWVKSQHEDTSYDCFRTYMDQIFSYASTISLSQHLQKVNLESVQIGDVFVHAGSPGHAELVIDMAIDKKTGKKIILLAQGYMPAQEIQILENPTNKAISPWYSVEEIEQKIYTPEYTFVRSELMRF